MSGHVYIVRGDLRALSCDAWLMPCDVELEPMPWWLDWPSGEPVSTEFPSLPEGWGPHGVRTVRFDAWPSELSRPWLTIVGASRTTDLTWFASGAGAFLDAAVKDATSPRHGRARPLLALPIVGTGYGGARHSAGEVVRRLLPVLREAAEQHDVDVALVANEGAAHAAAQAVRGRARDQWPALDDTQFQHARALASLAARGELVLFLGAGVGVGAGLPLWAGLLSALGERSGMSSEDQEAMRNLGHLDQARILENRLGGSRQLGEAIAALLDRSEVSLAHCLLAGLPVREAVTTNYDRLFELASSSVGKRVAVLPHEPASHCDRWVLKMHGCVTRPEEIVLTRQDYIRYAERRAALAAIVQTLLITRHMLFVGFGLDDDNFHRIADAVRKALPRREPDRAQTDAMGTSLVLEQNPLSAELWRGDIELVNLRPEADSDARGAPSLSGAARRLDIFLDCLSALATTQTGHVLDRRYDAVLSPGERDLSEGLRRFVRSLPPAAKRGPAWELVRGLLERLGWSQRWPNVGESEL